MIGLKEYSRNSNKGTRQLLMFLVSNNNPLQASNVALKSFLACSGRTAAVLTAVGWMDSNSDKPSLQKKGIPMYIKTSQTTSAS